MEEKLQRFNPKFLKEHDLTLTNKDVSFTEIRRKIGKGTFNICQASKY